MSARETTMRYQIGVASVALTSNVRSLLDQHAALYRQFRVERHSVPDEQIIRIGVTPTPFSLKHRRRFVVTVNDRTQFEPARVDEVLPYVEWAVNWELPRVMPGFLQLHASSLELDGAGIILPGDSGSGKSTLTAGLVAGGAKYLCDEFALIDSDTLKLHPYPRAICIKKPSYAAVESVGFTPAANRYYFKGSKGHVTFINPTDARPDAIGGECRVRYVIFPKYVAGAEPTLIPINRAEAAFALHGVCFNLLTCEVVGLDVLAGLVRGAKCFRLVSGEIHKTCDLVRNLVRSEGKALAKSA